MADILTENVAAKKVPDNREKPPELAQPDKPVDPMEEYADHLRSEDALEEKIVDAEERIEEDHASIEQLRASMGLPPDPDLETIGDKHISALRRQEQGVEEAIKDEERGILGLPEGAGENVQSKKNEMDVLLTQEQEAEGIEKEAREEFVKEFISAAIVKMEEDFGLFLDGSKNADNAKQLMRQKIGVEVQNKAKDFIENGGEPDFAFKAELKGAEFDSPEGGVVRYVTEFNIIFEDGVSTIEETPGGGSDLVDSDGQEQLQSAKEQGELEQTNQEA